MPETNTSKVAYFSMEIALEPGIPARFRPTDVLLLLLRGRNLGTHK